MASRATELHQSAKPFSGLSSPTRDIADTKNAAVYCGFLPKDSIDGAKALIDEYDGLLYIGFLEQDGDFTPCMVAAHRSIAAEARMKLKEFAFTDARLAEDGGTIKEQIDAENAAIAKLDEDRAETEKRAGELVADRNLLLLAEDCLKNKAARIEAVGDLGATETVRVITGLSSYDEDI